MDSEIRSQLKTLTEKRAVLKILTATDEKTSENSNSDYKRYIIGITACPAAVAHTYMAAQKLEDYVKAMGYAVKIEKQDSNGFEDKLTSEDVKNANVLIMATDINAAEQERFVDIPILKVAVADPLHNVEKVFNNALNLARNISSQQIPVIKQEDSKLPKNRHWFKLHFKAGAVSLKNAVLKGISYAVPVIVAGTAIQAIITIINQVAGVNYITAHANLLNTLGNVLGKALSILLAPVLAAYIVYAMADKPGLTPGFLGVLAWVYVTKTSSDGIVIVDGLGFLEGLIIGIIVDYLMKLFKKYLVSKKIQGVLTWFVYPVLGSLISMCLILFVIGQPVIVEPRLNAAHSLPDTAPPNINDGITRNGSDNANGIAPSVIPIDDNNQEIFPASFSYWFENLRPITVTKVVVQPVPISAAQKDA
ncbi:hypothetical protein P344_01970 [Spiroplasma mirum ATCC 29335]|uniref:PTS EIIB type-2 domain-containing protein n=1 Tax=Spiroplasma mirum ATCC 29335 TaxID=838561 RepID=W0GKS8_9MOLU|nr:MULTISPECIES: fructose PTS transporter subunit IIB [Spiroplasma]AHF60782.1 Phosphotransferase system fructose-specific component IIB (C-terminal truncated) [Spiroplasma mirum ATCC 29335]AHI57742.1 hypothetical protein P344_01970 [Spiroplasma mirum ATCC 29335]